MKIPRFKLWQRIILSLFSLIILILFLAPRVARIYLVNHSSELIGRTLELQKVRLNYFSGALKIKELQLYEADQKSIFLSFDKFKVNLDYWPLIKKEVRISEISLNELYIKIEQNGTLFNFSDLISSSDTIQKDTLNINSEEKEAYTLTFSNINLIKCHIHYSDLLLEHTISLDDIDLHIPGFTLNSGSTNLAVDFDFVKGGRFYSALHFNQSNNAYALNLRLDSLNLDILEPYIKKTIDISEIKDYFTINIKHSGDIEHITNAHLSGWNQVDSLSILDQDERNILSLTKFRVEIDTLLLDRNQIRISEISLLDPFILFELIDTSNNWMAMMVPGDTLSADSLAIDTLAAAEKSSFDFSLARLTLQHGRVSF